MDTFKPNFCTNEDLYNLNVGLIRHHVRSDQTINEEERSFLLNEVDNLASPTMRDLRLNLFKQFFELNQRHFESLPSEDHPMGEGEPTTEEGSSGVAKGTRGRKRKASKQRHSQELDIKEYLSKERILNLENLGKDRDSTRNLVLNRLVSLGYGKPDDLALSQSQRLETFVIEGENMLSVDLKRVYREYWQQERTFCKTFEDNQKVQLRLNWLAYQTALEVEKVISSSGCDQEMKDNTRRQIYQILKKPLNEKKARSGDQFQHYCLISMEIAQKIGIYALLLVEVLTPTHIKKMSKKSFPVFCEAFNSTFGNALQDISVSPDMAIKTRHGDFNGQAQQCFVSVSDLLNDEGDAVPNRVNADCDEDSYVEIDEDSDNDLYVE